MEANQTNKRVLKKGIQTLLITLLFMFVGPIVLYLAFSNTQKPLYILLLILGLLLCAAAVYFGFKGLQQITDSMFEKENSTKR